jgi:hypothetical protein
MKLLSNGIEMDQSPDKFGELTASNDVLDNFDKLRGRMDDNGY